MGQNKNICKKTLVFSSEYSENIYRFLKSHPLYMISVTKQVLDGKSEPVQILNTNKYTMDEIEDAIKYDYLDEIMEEDDELLSESEEENLDSIKRVYEQSLISILVDHIKKLNELAVKLDNVINKVN